MNFKDAAAILLPEYLIMDRDDDRGSIYDSAERDYMDEARWHQIELEEEREANLEAALDEAKDKGVSVASLKALAMEGGATRWAIRNSLKGNGDATDR